MNGTVARSLRRIAESQTTGKHKRVTRRFYQILKKHYKSIRKH